MSGGLLQMIITGKQDVYLTYNPQITFFIKKFKRYTHYSREYQKIYPEQAGTFNTELTFKIPNGDLLNNCFIEIDLPAYEFYDNKYVINKDYDNNKENELVELNKIYNSNNAIYNTLAKYINIEIDLYRNILTLFEINNITLNDIKKNSLLFNQKNNINKNLYINKININIFKKIDISSYIITLQEELNDTSITSIKNVLNNYYKTMIFYLKYYNDTLTSITKRINYLKSKKIKFSYSKYLGHSFIKEYELNIGGSIIQSYTNDILHIKQLTSLSSEKLDNYLTMIGHIEKLYEFNDKKNKQKIVIPLIFWFNNNANVSLPITSLKYSDISITIKLNDVRKIINFENYIEEFKALLKIELFFNDINKIIFNKNLIYNNFVIDYNNSVIKYECIYINTELLKLQFPNLLNHEIDYILEDCGTSYTEEEIYELTNKKYPSQILITKFDWVKLMKSLNEPNKKYKDFYYKFASYYPYIDFNILYNTIQEPNISLITEMIYLTDEERLKFTNSKLEYIIESYNENVYTINNLSNYECYLSFTNPCKELYWFIQPKLYNFGLSEYSENLDLVYDSYEYFENNIILKQQLSFENIQVLLDNIDIVDNNYYTYAMSYKYLSNILPNGVYYKSFALYPEDSQPSGSINFKYFKSKFYSITINPEFKKEYNNLLMKLYNTTANNFLNLKFISKNYDLVIIHKGKLNILFDV